MRSSLRLQLLAWLLVPLGFLVAVNTWLSFRDASATATAVQDRMLLGAVRIIAEQTYYRAGELHVEVPPAALELFESASRDRVYYRVVSPRGALLLGYPELASQIWEQAIVHQLIMLGLAIVLMWLGLRFGLRPLIRLRDAVLERRPGALEPLDPGPVPQELAPLVTAVNEYVRRLDEHMAAHGRFVAYASHQLRTALSVLNTQVSFALGSEDAAAREDALKAIRNGVRDGIRLVNQLLTLFMAEAAAHSAPRQAEVDLAEVVQRVLEESAPAAQAKQIDLGFQQRGGALVRGTPSMLHELVANLVDNAIRYTPHRGVVTAAIEGAAERVTLRIEDNGPGIPAEQRERVFERFYRLHEDGAGGSGLGLPIVREIAAASRASVQLSDPGQGTGLVVSVVFA